MSRTFFRATTVLVMALGLSSYATAAVPDGFVGGFVNVKNRDFKVVSNELGGSFFFPGQTLTISVSGTVDINPADAWEEECFIGICKRKKWIEHHFFSAADWVTLFRVVDEGGQVVVSNVPTQNGRLTLTIPQITPQLFNRKLRLEGLIVDGSPPINSRSQGQFTIKIEVTTTQRAAALPAFLSATRPRASDLKPTWIYDPFFVEQNRTFLAKELAAHAKLNFPAEAPLSALEHRALLDYAAEIDPSSTTVSFAVADMYLAQKNPAGAETELSNLIRNLRQRPGAATDPIVQFSVAEAHLRLASAIESARGYVEQRDLADISANYTTAIEIASAHRAPLLHASALFGRASASRSRNTPMSMKLAIDDFKRAREFSPRPLAGLPVGATLGGEELLVVDGASITTIAWKPIGQAKRPPIIVDAGRVQLWPLALSRTGRILASNREAIGWVDLTDQKPEFKVGASLKLANLPQAVTNGRSSILTAFTGSSHDRSLMRENFLRTPITIDGVTAYGAELAANAERYLAIGNKPPDIVVELRDIGKTGETPVRRIQLPRGATPLIMRISADGKRFGGLMWVPDRPRPNKSVLTVWDEKGQAIELASRTGAMQGPPVDLIENFDFTPDGQSVIVATTYGSLGTMAIKQGTTMDMLIMPEAGSPRGTRLFWAGLNTLLVASGGPQSPPKTVVVDWPARTVREVSGENLVGGVALGFWADASTTLGVVQPQAVPYRVRSIRTSDAGVIAESSSEQSPFGIQLLRGGRFACVQGASSVDVKDLVTQDQTTIARMPSPENRDLGYPMCIPTNLADGWVLVRHNQQGQIRSVSRYRGSNRTNETVLPDIPDDLLQMEKAAALQPGYQYVAPGYTLPQFVGMPVPIQLGLDGKMFAVAIPNTAWKQATTQPATKWISVPFVMLQEPDVKVSSIRLPAGGYPLQILQENKKIIYLRGSKVFWKDADADSEGGVLFEVSLPKPGAVGSAPGYSIRSNKDGSRFIVSEVYWKLDNAVDIATRIFAVSADQVQELPCALCKRRSIDTKAFVPSDNLRPGLNPWHLIQPDQAIDHMVAYVDTQVVVHQVSGNKPIALLPSRPIAWVNDDRAFYISGENELSFIRY